MTDHHDGPAAARPAVPAGADVARALFEQSPFSTVLYDVDGRIVAANAAFERLFGLRTADLPSDYSVLRDPQLEAAGLTPRIRRAFAGEAVALDPVRYDAATLSGTGRLTWTQGHFFPMRGADGAITGVVLVHVDLTERIVAEHAAVEARTRLEEQAGELRARTRQLQEQATAMESQQAELELQAEELQQANEDLASAAARAESARQAAERAEAWVAGVLGGIGDPFVVHDPGWRFEYVNAAAARIFAASGHDAPGGLLGVVVWEAYPELVGGTMEREMRRAMETRTPVTFVDLHAPTGAWSEMRCYPMPGGGLATLWRDITAQKQAEEARHFLSRASGVLAGSLDRDETARRVASLLVPQLADWCAVQLVEGPDALRQVAVAHVDPEKVAWAEDLHRRYPPDPAATTGAHEVVRTGRPLLMRDVPDALLVAAAVDAEHLRILRGIGFASAVVVPLTARGRVLGAMTLVAAESGRRYGDAELALAGELASRAALAIDNAALYEAAVRARDALAERTAQAEQARADADHANRAKADFLATMSHELRTPLNAIGGYAQLMEMGVHGPVTPAQAEALARVQRSQQHLLSLINDVLNFAKLEAGRVQYDIARVAVRPLVAEAEALVAPQLAARALRYDGEAVDPALHLLADGEKVQQILLNLLSNAIKFTPEGGEIRVRAAAEGTTVRIIVSDTGIGIPPDKHDAIFEPFVQLARKGAPGKEGTGLGLAISRDLARAMGGELVVAAVEGEGSAFELRLPKG